MVIALMAVFPFVSAVIQLLSGQHAMLNAAAIIPVVAKWYVFWAVGVRLFLAGLRQIIQPRYTAETILGIKGEDALLVVRELGFANSALGSRASQQIGEHRHGVGYLCGAAARRLRSRGAHLTTMLTLSDFGSKTIRASPRRSCRITPATLSSSETSFSP